MHITLRSIITPSLLRKTLFKGTFFASLGALCLFYSSTWLPADVLKTWGLLLFLGSMALITLGLLPYRRLKELESRPYLLKLEDDHWLIFSAKNQDLFKVKLETIETCSYMESPSMYGIALNLKKNKKVIVLQTHLNFKTFFKASLNQKHPDIFLPYFSRRSFQHLQEII